MRRTTQHTKYFSKNQKHSQKIFIIFDTNNTKAVTFNPLMYNDPKWSNTKTSKMEHFAIIVKASGLKEATSF